MAIKDLFDTAGILTTIGSRFFADYVPETDAFVVEKLKLAGAILLGKTNTHEIALGVTGNNPHYGTARNPWDTTRIPGGSSSGSAIAVATGMALGALGTDTGGSIRIPASLCGVVGFKPTYGRVSLRGVFPLSWNLDHVGPLARCVKDAALMLQVISTYGPLDPASVKMVSGDFARLTGALPAHRGFIGIQPGRTGWGEELSPAVAAALPRAVEQARMLLTDWCRVRSFGGLQPGA